MRTTIILSGIVESLPKDLSTETINAKETPLLSCHVLKHSFAFSARHPWRESGTIEGEQKYLTVSYDNIQ